MQAIVIDDSRAMRSILKRGLTGIGLEVREACDGKDGLLRLSEGPAPALALVDWNMPNMNGLDFIKAVRQDPKYDQMKIMMVTTEVEMNQIQSALTAGANEYLMKPFTDEGLREKVSMMGFGQEAA